MQHTPLSEAPPLALDDILHAMSPSPTPQPLTQGPPSTLPEHHYPFAANVLHNAPITDSTAGHPRESSPEPLDYSELESMRARVRDYAFSQNSTEAELAAMVLRLTSHFLLHPSPAQLASQADTIAELTFQRNMLLRERADELERWQSERESWARTADILLAKARVAHEPVVQDQDSQRYVARLEDDLKASRRRLADTQARLSALERELSRLRPLLSLHATLLSDPHLWHADGLSAFVAERYGRNAPRDPGAGFLQAYCPPPDAGTSLPSTDSTQRASTDAPPPSSSHLVRASKSKTDKHHHHRKERDKDRDKDKKHRHRHKGTSLLTDARAECILAAARRFGRVRAGIISGLVKERTNHEHPADEQNNKADQGRHVLFSPPTSHPRPIVLGPTTSAEPHVPREGEAGSSSPPVPLAAAYQSRESGSRTAQRRLAPSPFATPGPSLAIARQPHLPTHLHPSAQTYAPTAQGRHTHPIPHPGYMYFAPGPGQAASFVMPIPWPVPGTPPAPPPPPTRPMQARAEATSETPKTQTPARGQNTAFVESASTPMDSLVSAARTLIEDEDYDGTQLPAEGTAETDETPEEDAVEDDTPVRRRGTRRRAAGAAPDSPAPKRRRVGGTTRSLDTPPAAGPSTTRATRKGKATAAPPAPSETQEKPKARGRPKGKGKEKAGPTPLATIPPEPDSSGSSSQAAPAPTAVPTAARMHAPQVARIRSALDVLADQAAQEQERRPSLGPASRRNSESDGKEDEVEAQRTPTPAAATMATAGEVPAQDEDAHPTENAPPEQTDAEPSMRTAEAQETPDVDIDASDDTRPGDPLRQPDPDLGTSPVCEETEEQRGTPTPPPLSPSLPPEPTKPATPLPLRARTRSRSPLPPPTDAEHATSRAPTPASENASPDGPAQGEAAPLAGSFDVTASPAAAARPSLSVPASPSIGDDVIPAEPGDTASANRSSVPPPEVEIESGDEDAEGSIVEEAD